MKSMQARKTMSMSMFFFYFLLNTKENTKKEHITSDLHITVKTRDNLYTDLG